MSASWMQKRLGDIISLEYGKPLDKSKRVDNGMYPAYGANGEKCRTNQFLVDRPSIVVGRKGSAGEVTLVSGKFWPLDVTYFVTFDEQKYDLQFLYYLLLSLNLPKLATGVKPGINRNRVYSLAVSIPEIEEQKRIVTSLDEAFADIDKARQLTDQNLKNARELFACYLRRAFEHPSDKITYDWLDNIAKFSGGGTPSKKEASFWTGEIPWVSPKDMKSEIIFDSIDHISKKAVENSSASLVKKGAILVVVRSGILARTIPIAMAGSKLTVNQDLKVLTTKPGIVAEYLYFFLRSKESFLLDKVTRGATVHRLSTDTLKELKVPILSEKDQTFLAENCEKLKLEIERVVDIYTTKLDYLDELRNSLLSKAFSGKLDIAKGI